MVERLTNAWTTIPHFYLAREVDATELITWRERALKRVAEKVTYTDLLGTSNCGGIAAAPTTERHVA